MKKFAPVLAVSALVVAGLVALALPINAVESGNAKGVDPDASAIAANGTRTLRVGDDVAIGETIETGATGQVQLLFDDKTEFVIGPSSKLRLDDYLVRDDGSAGQFAVAALAGTFRFATGNADHSRYEIKTPTGTIGVRGTRFDFAVIQQALTEFLGPSQWITPVLLFDGSVQLCSNSGACATIAASCGFGIESELEAVLVDNTRQNRTVLRAYFPYALDQSPLLQSFWVANARNCIAPPPSADGTPQTLGTSVTPRETTQPTSTQTPTTTVIPTTTVMPSSTVVPTSTVSCSTTSCVGG